jgi:hypothetical protein
MGCAPTARALSTAATGLVAATTGAAATTTNRGSGGSGGGRRGGRTGLALGVLLLELLSVHEHGLAAAGHFKRYAHAGDVAHNLAERALRDLLAAQFVFSLALRSVALAARAASSSSSAFLAKASALCSLFSACASFLSPRALAAGYSGMWIPPSEYGDVCEYVATQKEGPTSR